MNDEHMLTTLDNPYSPFDRFDEWNAFDVAHGYNTCAYLARIAKTSEELSDLDNSLEIERAIDEILQYNPLNYIKVTRESFELWKKK